MPTKRNSTLLGKPTTDPFSNDEFIEALLFGEDAPSFESTLDNQEIADLLVWLEANVGYEDEEEDG
jgi:hypothetical protein